MKGVSIIRENKYYTVSELLRNLELNAPEFLIDILGELREIGYLKVKSNSDFNASISIEKIFLKIKDSFLENEVLFSIQFVGVIELSHNITIISYPKYMSKVSVEKDVENNFSKFKQIMKVLKKYQYRKEHNLNKVSDNESNLNNLLGLKLQILDRYYEKGLYNKEKEQINLNQSGQILWNKTINENVAYIINKTPIYLDLYTKETVLDIWNIIREIHEVILSEISMEMEDLLNILEYSPVLLTEKTINDFANIDYIIGLIEEEINNQYVTERIECLTEMLMYLKQKVQDQPNDIQLYGTNAFNLVWEDVCRVVYNNHLDYTFKKLGIINPKKPSDDNITMKEFVEKPLWLNTNNEFVEASSTLELDVLNINDNEFNIYDAKYYNISFNNNGIKGQPGVSDVTKQYLYQLLFKDVIEVNKLVPSNNFIIPKDEPKVDNEEYTVSRMNMFHEIGENLKPINVIARNCEVVYNQYLKMV